MRLLRSNQGGISIFLCIILVPMLVITGILIDMGRIKAAEVEVQRALDLSLRSVLAGVQEELITEYGIFSLDCNTGLYQEDFKRYLDMNLKNTEKSSSWYLDFNIEEMALDPSFNLRDPEVLEKQIVEFMKFRGPLNISLDVYEKFLAIKDLKRTFISEKKLAKEKEEENNSQENGSKDSSSETGNKPLRDNNAILKYIDFLKTVREKLTGKIKPEDIANFLQTPVSNLPQGNSPDAYAHVFENIFNEMGSMEGNEEQGEDNSMDEENSSGEKDMTGEGNTSVEGNGDGDDNGSSLENDLSEGLSSQIESFTRMVENSLTNMRDTLYVNEYILTHFSRYTDIKEARNFTHAEIEYIVFGRNDEKSNVLLSQSAIGAVRLAVRFMETFLDTKIPELKVRLLWALLKGLYLTMDDITKLFDREYERQNHGIELCRRMSHIKLSYPDYLRIMLIMLNHDEKLSRVQKLMQVNIRKKSEEAGNTGFILDKCSTMLEGRVTVSIKLWFLPMLQLDKLGSKNIRGGRFHIAKESFCAY